MTVEQHNIPPGMRLHPLRAGDLTASDIGAVAGVDRYRSPLRVFREKRGEVPSEEENNLMRRGRWLEPAVLAALREKYPDLDARPVGLYLRDPEIRLGATPDAMSFAPGGVVNIQMKVVTRHAYERDWDNGSAPLAYILQTLTEGMLMAAERSLLAALVIDTYSAELEIREVPRREDAEAKIRDIAVRFWENVENHRPPAADYSRDRDVLERMYPPQPGMQPIDLTGDNRLPDVLAARAMLKAEIKRSEEDCAAIDAEIIEKLAGAPAASCGPWKVTWREEHRKAYEVKEATRRVLRISGGMEDGQ